MVKTYSITVSGKVQGVYYRQSAKEKAQQLGVRGRVKNLPDGSVHLLATGSPEQLNQLVAWCKTGPSRAEVTDVHVVEHPVREFDGFAIER